MERFFPMSVFAVITEDGLDQVVETKAIAEREKRDLVKMGCSVRIKEFPTEAECYDWCDKHFR